MIIDFILDLKDGYEEINFDNMKYIYDEAMLFGFDYLSKALDEGSNKDIQNALCRYVIENDYNTKLCEFIKKQNFLEGIE